MQNRFAFQTMKILKVFSLACLILMLVPSSALPGKNGGTGKGGGKGGDGGAAAPSVEAALGFLRAQVGPAGLVDSFVEDNADYAYTYDNALAAMAFVSGGDFHAAGQILDAYLAIGVAPEGGFLHRYNSVSGAPAAGISGVGHNAYLLQAMNLYYRRTNDPKFNALAVRIADYLLTFQDVDGGLFGRPDVGWKSTENNLGAYSALHNLGVVQASAFYADRAGLIRNFLITECWDGTRFYTGENDPSIVTDTQALGGMILGATYSNGAYWVESKTLNSQRYEGRKRVTGFDLNTDKDTVWTEGTLQQALAYYVAGDLSKWDFYKAESEKLFQSSGAFWQASNRGTTGFGENFERWQAVAPTAWYIIVSSGDNPFVLLP